MTNDDRAALPAASQLGELLTTVPLADSSTTLVYCDEVFIGDSEAIHVRLNQLACQARKSATDPRAAVR